MPVAKGIRGDFGLELVENDVGGETLFRGIGIQIRGREIARERTKDGLLAETGQMFDDDVDGTVSDAPQIISAPRPLLHTPTPPYSSSILTPA